VTCTAPVGGFLLGFLDFVWIKFVPFPFAALGKPGAVLFAEAITLLRRHARRLTAVVLALPLALLGWAALALAPFGGVNQ
jgi:hypothetical protein